MSWGIYYKDSVFVGLTLYLCYNTRVYKPTSLVFCSPLPFSLPPPVIVQMSQCGLILTPARYTLSPFWDKHVHSLKHAHSLTDIISEQGSRGCIARKKSKLPPHHFLASDITAYIMLCMHRTMVLVLLSKTRCVTVADDVVSSILSRETCTSRRCEATMSTIYAGSEHLSLMTTRLSLPWLLPCQVS